MASKDSGPSQAVHPARPDNVSTQNRDKAIDLALAAIDKQFGKGAIMRLGKDPVEREVQVVPTGSLGLDIALGIGGLPRGRIVEIYGPESSGKTTLTLHIIAEAQKRGGVCAFIDAEHALDVSYAKKLGVKTEELLVSQPDFGEQALEIADMLVRSNAIDVIVIDSVAALTPKAELEGEMGDAHVGLQARLMSQALRKLTGGISRSKTMRSEEHTSELQSLAYLVCRLLLEKKNKGVPSCGVSQPGCPFTTTRWSAPWLSRT